ncbi:MAG: PAS domain S-box protein [Rhodospirillaceae bacterium]|jgi:PAS domain S-box-containing protein|nr:PAS domain S-box protein [Rhodospirillaceae bacterium]MBT5769088.1 PAS domain S-box protein [Rhodospirillaceae bacterium]MBT6310561.1 PAS domain S-box protein [Rhodospirillaceae bacterium]MBT7365099.1 PAS domain S-box protein [Rhodospirillaceae bacterium]
MFDAVIKYARYVILGVAGGLLLSGLAYVVMGRNFGFENVTPIAVAPGFLVGFVVTTCIGILIASSRARLIERLESENLVASDLRAENKRRSHAETNLHEAQENYRLVTESVPTGIIVHSAGAVVYANPAAVEMFGAASEREMLGMDPLELVDQGGRAEVLEKRRNRGSQQILTGSLRLRRARLDGSFFWSEGHARDIVFDDKPSTLVVIQNISEQVTIEDALEVSRERFKSFAEASADWLWEIDSGLRITFISDSVERIMGIPPAWFMGQSRTELAADAAGDKSWEEHVDDLEARRPFRNFEYLRRGDGQVGECWIRSSGTPIFGDEGEFLGYRGTASDVTEYKQAEEQLRDSEERLAQAEKLKSVGQLTGGIAHDFNNLLAVIQGNAELLGDDLEPENAPLRTILRATKRGSDLTQRLLSYSRRQPLRPETIDLSHHVAELTELLARTLGEAIKVETHIADDIASVVADPGQLENALLNLSINARDAMPQGGTLTIACSNVSLDVGDFKPEFDMDKGEYVVLAVSDTGQGMSNSVREQAFEPFFTTKDVGEGSGLGLSMVYGFAHQSGGDASIESEAGRGTTVKIRLPVAAVATRPAAPAELRDVATGNGGTILVLEDDADVRGLTVRILEGLGYTTIEAADAEGASRVLASGARPRLILSDVILPGGTSGPQFADAVREQHPGIKIIFMSGYPEEVSNRDSLLRSDSKILTKPFGRDDLAQAVNTALGN